MSASHGLMGERVNLRSGRSGRVEFRSEMKAGKQLLTRQAIPAEAVHTGSKESHRKRNVLLGIIIAFVVVIAIAAAVSTLKPNPPNPCVFSSQSFAVSSDGSKSLQGLSDFGKLRQLGIRDCVSPL